MREMLLRGRTREILGNVEVASSAGAELTGEQSNKREPRSVRWVK